MCSCVRLWKKGQDRERIRGRDRPAGVCARRVGVERGWAVYDFGVPDTCETCGVVS